MVSQKRYFTFFVLIFSFVTFCFYIDTRLKGFYSLSEIKLWESISLLNLREHSFEVLFNTPPLFILNVIKFSKFLVLETTVMTPFFLIYILVLYCLIQLARQDSLHTIPFKKFLFYCITFLNPISLYLFCNKPMLIAMTYSLHLSLKGLHHYNQKRTPQGLLLFAIGSVTLLLSGDTSLCILIAIFISSPFWMKRKDLAEHMLPSYLLYFFPSVAALASVFYLSWLSQGNPEEALLHKSLEPLIALDLWAWSLILPFSLYYAIKKNWYPLLPFIAYFVAFFLQYDVSAYSLFMASLFLLTFRLLIIRRLRLKHFVLMMYFIAVSYFLTLNQSSKDFHSFYQALLGHELSKSEQANQSFARWYLSQKKRATVIATNRYATVLRYHSDHQGKIVTPKSPSFHTIVNSSMLEVERLIVSNPHDLNLPLGQSNHHKISQQLELFHHGKEGMHLVFDNKSWRVYERDPVNYLKSLAPSQFNQILNKKVQIDIFHHCLLLSFIMLVIYFVRLKVRL